jgi:hypothetical protein
MKKILIVIVFFAISQRVSSQIVIDSSMVNFISQYPNVEIVPVAKDTSYWKSYNVFEALFSENYLKDWASGGNNSVMGLLKFDWHADYNRANLNWTNYLRAEYGLSYQEEDFLRKSNDRIDYTANLGYKIIEEWYASTQFRLTTQFANGYEYKSDGNHILKSSFLSPGRIFIGIGARYTKDENFYMYISPFTENINIVLNHELARSGDINKNSERVFIKIGPLVDLFWNYQFYKNYILTNKVSIYSDYVYNFGSIDFFDWQLDLAIPLHEYFTVSFGFYMKYDKDLLFDVEGSTSGEKERRVQIRQILGIGFKYEI